MKIDKFMQELNDIHALLNDNVNSSNNLTEKLEAIDKYISDIKIMKNLCRYKVTKAGFN